jgi:hypothetical protein
LELASLLIHTAAIIISQHTESEVRIKAEEALRESEKRFGRNANNSVQRIKPSTSSPSATTDVGPDF